MIEQADNYISRVYEHTGPELSTSVVQQVKSHHSEKFGVDFKLVSGREIARNGDRAIVVATHPQ